MKEKMFRGCGTALVTPFKDGAVDFEALGGILERQKAAGIHFLVPLGTTAETPCLSATEKVDILVYTKECCPDAKIIAGAGSNSLTGTLENIRLLTPCDPDAFLIVVPFYNKPTQEGMYQYFKAVAESTDKKIVMYNVPGRTGSNMLAETTLRLAEIPNIVAVKEASGKYSQIAEIIRCAPEGFSVLSGNDDETLSLMATGADGVISVASNIAPGPIVKLVEAIWADRMDEARRLFHLLLPLYRNCFVEPNPIPVKAGMSLLGLLRNELRLPLTPATPSTIELMQKTLDKLEL
ncbi:MAG: 4-hydroxy-tetrahydrodipicolinate synthase [Bacteroidales bacterium]|nr:4-hydroxy-tetrahydrodipicolinate synthase [Bacteroidales bacterium]